jgi:hypothetical protein
VSITHSLDSVGLCWFLIFLPLNQRVDGSSPSRPTKKKSISINNDLCRLIGVGFSFTLNLSPILFHGQSLNQLDSVLQNHLDMIIESLNLVDFIPSFLDAPHSAFFVDCFVPV